MLCCVGVGQQCMHMLCSTAEHHIADSAMTDWGGDIGKAKSSWGCLALLHSMCIH